MLPVNYFQAGDILYLTSLRCCKWWRNLRSSKPVRVWLLGQLVQGRGTADEGSATVLENLKNFFQNRPDITRYFGFRLEPNDQPNTQDIPGSPRARESARESLLEPRDLN